MWHPRRLAICRSSEARGWLDLPYRNNTMLIENQPRQYSMLPSRITCWFLPNQWDDIRQELRSCISRGGLLASNLQFWIHLPILKIKCWLTTYHLDSSNKGTLLRPNKECWLHNVREWYRWSFRWFHGKWSLSWRVLSSGTWQVWLLERRNKFCQAKMWNGWNWH